MRRAHFTDTEQADESADVQPASQRYACAAHGCPCAGAILSGNLWLCSAHFGKDPEHWPEITACLANRRALLRAMDVAGRFPAGTKSPKSAARALLQVAQQAGMSLSQADLQRARQAYNPVTLIAHRLHLAIRAHAVKGLAQLRQPRGNMEQEALRALESALVRARVSLDQQQQQEAA
jgi:hypothetical protein